MPKSKRIRLFAGPNGSGKTTLYHSLSVNYNVGKFVNADIIEKELSEKGLFDLNSLDLSVTQKELEKFKLSDPGMSFLKKASSEQAAINCEIRENFIVNRIKSTNSYEAAFMAAFLRSILVERGKTFSFETVMSHPSKLDEIRNARKKGYRVYLYFVCTDDPDLNVSRIKNRVDKGGHHVDEKRVISRYKNTLSNLFQAIELSYRAYLFDNSGKEQVMLAEFYKGDLELKVDNLPGWFIQYVLPFFSPEE